jgi:oligoribonuclease NrnB/cAMP/cGMP phosphodiesterase (DHH superfamily)
MERERKKRMYFFPYDPPEQMPPNVDLYIDMDRSGARLALDYFSPPTLSVDGPQRQAFMYIEDGDLWRWAIPESKAWGAGLATK